MCSSKTSGIPELTLCTLTPEVRDQGLAIMSGHWPHMIQRKSRPLVNVWVRCADNYNHPIDKSTPGQNVVICVCAQVSWGGKCWRRGRIWPKLPLMLNQQGFGSVTCLPCQFTWDPLAQSGQRAGSSDGLRPMCHVPTSSKGIERRWDSLNIRSVIIIGGRLKIQSSIKETKMKSRVLKICTIFWYI